jgi:hypothetical protein
MAAQLRAAQAVIDYHLNHLFPASRDGIDMFAGLRWMVCRGKLLPGEDMT